MRKYNEIKRGKGVTFWLWSSFIIKMVMVVASKDAKVSSLDNIAEQISPRMCKNLITRYNLTLKECLNNFPRTDIPLHTSPAKLELKCQKVKSVRLKVHSVEGLDRLVVLLPSNGTLINYSKIIYSKWPQSIVRIDELHPGIHYTSHITVIAANATRSVWHRGIDIHPYVDKTSHLKNKYHVRYEIPFGEEEEKTFQVKGRFYWDNFDDTDNCFSISNECVRSQPLQCDPVDKIIEPDSNRSIVIVGLHMSTPYKFVVTGKYGTTKIEYWTPSVVKKNGVVITMPTRAENITLKDQSSARKDWWNLKVTWKQFHNRPEYYNLSIGSEIGGYIIRNISVSGNITELTFENLTITGAYFVTIAAHSSGATNYTTAYGILHNVPSPDDVAAPVASGVGAALAAASLLLALREWRRRRHHRNVFHGMKAHLKACNKKWELNESLMMDDKWEITPDKLKVDDTIGEGAFGVVRKGILLPNGKEVAVKMLKDFPSIDEIRSFRAEMELMKSVGSHPHVVSLVGCCSASLLLVAEYCAKGDLLTYLRNSWDMMVKRRNIKYCNNNIDSADNRNDLLKNQQVAITAINKLYEIEEIYDDELTLVDLLSFCRQIAMGMEFLASNRVVHRDLAARNILVAHDNTLKIADFGLSRDVYQDNKYKQKGNGKMPVKWMAIESLVHRVFTSQSDVWSFGVVMWEVLTVGGSPYGGVPLERLARLLRAGYRLQRPVNCSQPLYELMLSCWSARPRDRPTFSSLHAQLDSLLNSVSAHQYLALDREDGDLPPPRISYLDSILLRTGLKRPQPHSYDCYERPHPVYNDYTSSPDASTKTVQVV